MLLVGMVGSREGWVDRALRDLPRRPGGDRRRADPGRSRRRPPGPYRAGPLLRAGSRRRRRDARRGDARARLRRRGRARLPARHASQMGPDARRAHRALRHLHDRRDVRAPARALDDRAPGDRARRSDRLRPRPRRRRAQRRRQRRASACCTSCSAARAAVVSGRMAPRLLGPYLSGPSHRRRDQRRAVAVRPPDDGDHRRRSAARRPLRRGARPPRHRDDRQRPPQARRSLPGLPALAAARVARSLEASPAPAILAGDGPDWRRGSR